MVASSETCTSQYGCKGNTDACVGVGDIDDQMAQLLNGNFHEQSAGGIEDFLKRKETNVLPVCMQQAVLRERIRRARQEAKQFFEG
jgi:hypothetical protein